MWSKRYVITSVLLCLMMLPLPIYTTAANSTTVAVNPASSYAAVGESFTVNITVTNVTNLATWEIQMFYLNTILNCTNTAAGPFLESGGSSAFFASTVNNAHNATHGWLMIGATLLGPAPGVNGSGTLGTITFKALARGDTPLTLTGTSLKDATPPPLPRNPIPHTAIDGTVHVTGIMHDVAVNSVSKLKTVVCQGYACNISVAVENQGDFTETFNVTAYANATAIQTKTLTLTSGDTTTPTFTWNAGGFAKGNYSISAYALPVPGETDMADNNFTDGWVFVSMVGDLTGGTSNVWDFVPDGKVSGADVSVVSRCFGSSPDTVPPLRWEPNCDLNNNGKVDGSDVAFVARHFGESDP